MMPDGVVAGFAVFGDARRPVEFLLHPSDTRTGLRYRLIPMTRGILSGIFSPQQAERHVALLREHLVYPDGARLMDRPTIYHGGIERTFRRSESAAFFGREIGLQYVHAHLRYAEAMAAMGWADELWRALLVVNPIAVTDVVPNARPRQRNCYFSSSDADFKDRYQASREYEKLRSGQIPTDGGWRIYSSGPGIYASVVIRHLFGLRRYFDTIVFDPVLPRELDRAVCDLVQDGRRVRYEFAMTAASSATRVTVNDVPVEWNPVANPYRSGGMSVRRDEFEKLLTLPENRVRIAL
jgi:cellobiose phosphorylase